MVILLLVFISILGAQVVPYESSSIKNLQDVSDRDIYLSDQMYNEDIKINLKNYSRISKFDNQIFLEATLLTQSLKTIRLELSFIDLPLGTKFFLLDSMGDQIIGPFYIDDTSSIMLGPIHSSNFIVQCIIPRAEDTQDYRISITGISDLSTSTVTQYSKYFKELSLREDPVIVVTGFWPPTNEMLRHFSQDLSLNPDGWQGEDWQGSGYDIIAFSPEFENPDCDNCGQGYGDFEVDYQDTSYDFWRLIDELDPVSIITFSRGYIDYSWELEFNFYNRTNWGPDYTAPFSPTPNPPDSEEETNFLRNSTLPMQDIMDAVNESNLDLNSYIDINGDPGHFVSEFMGYHGVWYHDLNQFNENVPCYLAGHVHVGGLIDWDTATQAAEITIEEVIEALEEYTYVPGDVNDDANIDILDIVVTVSHILGQQVLEGSSFYAADMNSNGIINILDVILLINLIL